MRAAEYYQKLEKELAGRDDIVIKKYPLNYRKKKSLFWRIASKQIGRNDRIILIRAGIHGDEISGPLTILHQANQIIDYVHQRGLKIIIYPLGNPTGFESGWRYNIDKDRGPAGNNDFLRYELKNGKIIDDLKNNNIFKKWHWSSEPKLKIRLPLETQLAHRLLKKELLKQVVACIDFHQDYISPVKKSIAYHYAFGNLKAYADIIKKISKIVPVWKNTQIGAGFNMSAGSIKSDKSGFIIRHDGTLPDLFFRLGAKHCVTAETSGVTPLAKAEEVNLAWIFGITDLLPKQIVKAEKLLVVIPHGSIRRPKEIKKSWLSKNQNRLLYNETAETDRGTEKLYDFRKILNNQQLVFSYSQVYINAVRNPSTVEASAPNAIRGVAVYKKPLSVKFRKKLLKKYFFPFYKKIAAAKKTLIFNGHSTMVGHSSLGKEKLKHDIVLSSYQIDKGKKVRFAPDEYLDFYAGELKKRMPSLKIGKNSVYSSVYDHICAKEGKRIPIIHQETDENLYIKNNKINLNKLKQLRKIFAESLLATMRRLK